MRNSKLNTTVVNRRIVFLKDDAGWYADMEGTRDECDFAWEAIKRELVHYTARKFNLPEPQDLSEKPEDYPFMPPHKANFNQDYPLDNLLAYRMRFEVFFCGLGKRNPSWSRSQAWVNLRNAMLDEMFDRVGVDLPPEAHSLPYMYNGRKPETWKRLLPKRHGLHAHGQCSTETNS